MSGCAYSTVAAKLVLALTMAMRTCNSGVPHRRDLLPSPSLSVIQQCPRSPSSLVCPLAFTCLYTLMSVFLHPKSEGLLAYVGKPTLWTRLSAEAMLMICIGGKVVNRAKNAESILSAHGCSVEQRRARCSKNV